MERIMDVLKAISQPTRLRTLLLLSETELCACELGLLLGITQPAVSQHMNVLKKAELVTERKSGTWVYYQLDRQHLEQALNWLGQAFSAPRRTAGSEFVDWGLADELLAKRAENCPECPNCSSKREV